LPHAHRRLELLPRVAHGPEWAGLSDHFPIVVDTQANEH
jgi:hypothetical protein